MITGQIKCAQDHAMGFFGIMIDYFHVSRERGIPSIIEGVI